MGLRDTFQQEMKSAMRAKNDPIALSTIRLIIAALKDRDIAARQKANDDGITDDEILLMLQSMIKQRRESIKAYTEANRQELADIEANEIAIIERFLPEMMNDEAVSKVISDAIAEVKAESVRDMGKVMSILRARHAGKMDFAIGAEKLKQALTTS